LGRQLYCRTLIESCRDNSITVAPTRRYIMEFHDILNYINNIARKRLPFN
jgi:hypothetical protein